jgi:nucleotide sugar dehydrogenase
MKISVVGLGKIGLPIAVQYASKGHDVLGCDVNPAIVQTVNAGRIPVGIEGVAGVFEHVHTAGRLKATTDTKSAVRETDATVLVVPVGVHQGAPDYKYMDSAVAEVAKGLKSGHLVIFETTLAVGTTRNRFLPVLLKGNKDIHVAFSPERVQSHRVIEDLKKYPKVVGGVDEASTEKAAAFYEAVLDAPGILKVRDAETAEFVKLAESIYRDVNIALANELARFAHDKGLDISEVIAAANSEPLSNLHTPGVGVGGHCIPVYPYFLTHDRPDLEITIASRRINDSMADWTLERVAERIGGLKNKRVLVLGLSYRANIREAAESVAVRLVEALNERKAVALLADPFYSSDEIRAYHAEPFDEAEIDTVDAVILQALHDDFKSFPYEKLRKGTLVLDGRNQLSEDDIAAAGLRYLGVGRRLGVQAHEG